MQFLPKLTSIFRQPKGKGGSSRDANSQASHATPKVTPKPDPHSISHNTRDTLVNQSGVMPKTGITRPLISKSEPITARVSPAQGLQPTPGEPSPGQSAYHQETRAKNAQAKPVKNDHSPLEKSQTKTTQKQDLAPKENHASKRTPTSTTPPQGITTKVSLWLAALTKPKKDRKKHGANAVDPNDPLAVADSPAGIAAASPTGSGIVFPQLQQFMLGTALVTSVIGLVFLVRLQFVIDSPQSIAYPAALTRPARTLSFQGRLTDAAQNPVTGSTNMAFRLYDTGPGTGGTELWNSGTCSVTPDQDGIFAVGLGDECGAEIDGDVFSENVSVWLEVEVATETLTPRQSIKAVAYALNAETLQGYPAAAAAMESTVVVMNELGQIVLGNSTPIITATSPTGFTIEGQTLYLTTAVGSDGNVVIDPDGTGFTQILSDLQVTGAAVVDGLLTTNASLQVAEYATVGASLAVGYNNAPAGPGNGVFSGNLGVGTTNTAHRVTLAEATTEGGGIGFGNDVVLYRSSSNVLSLASGDSFNIVNGVLSAGGTTVITAARLIQAADGSEGAPAFSFSDDTDVGLFRPGSNILGFSTAGLERMRIGAGGNVGIGTTNATQLLHVMGNMRLTGGFFDSTNSPGSPGYVLSSTGTVTQWIDPVAQVGGTNLWDLTGEQIHPKNALWYDLVIGGTSSASATILAEAATGNVRAGRYFGTTNPAYYLDPDNGTTSLLTAGNVGIGSTSPGYELDVTGTIRASTSFISLGTISAASTITGNQLISTISTGTAPLQVASTTVVTNLNADFLDGFHANALPYVNNTANTTLTRAGAGPYTLELNLANANTWTGIQTFASDTFFEGDGIWDTSGNVGIGTTAPAQKLHVVGNARITALASSPSLPIKANADGDLLAAAIDLASGEVTGILPVSGGGTGANTLTGMLKGNGTSPVTAVTGTTNFVARWTDANTIGIGTIFDNGTNVGVGSTTGLNQRLNINGNILIGGNTIMDSGNTGRIGLGATTTLTNTTTTLSGTTTLTASSLATMTTAASVNWGGATTLTFTADNALINGSDVANGNLSLRGTSSGTKTTSYILLQDNGGNVGIGTTAPTLFRLQVTGDVGPTTNNTNNLGSNTNRWANIYGTNFFQNGNNVCDASGNCGVISWTSTNGAIHPLNVTQDLLMGGTATNSAKFAALNMNSGASGAPTASVSAGLAGGTFLTATGHLSTTARQNLTLGNSSTFNTTGDILLQPNGTRRVGIGTTTPTEMLHIGGNLRLTGAFVDSTNSPGGAGQVLTSTISGTDWVDASSLAVGDAGTLDGLDSSQFLRSDTSDQYTSGTLDFLTGTTININSGAQQIVASGATLDINGDLSIADTDIALDGANTNLNVTGNFSINTNHLFVQKSDGNIGLGTTAPTNALSFSNTAARRIGIENTASGTVGRALTVGAGSTVAGSSNIAGGNLTIQSGAGTGTGASSILFQTGTTLGSGSTLQTVSTKMIILGNGNVGIGSTTPTEALDVVGAVRFSGALMPNGSAGTAGFYLQSAGTGAPPVWADMTASLLPGGTNGQTLRHNGSSWVANSALFNDGANIGIGTTSLGTNRLTVHSTTANQLLFGYNSSNYFTTNISSAGAVTFDATGGSAGFTFSDPVTISGGSINGTTIGASTPSTGAFTTLSSTGATTLGNNSSTVEVNSNTWDVSTAGIGSGFTGFSSSGNIDLASLNAGGMVRAAPSTGRLEIAVAGTHYEVPLTFSNGLTRTVNAVALGGTLTGNTDIPLAGFNLAFSGAAGNVGVGHASPDARLRVSYTDTGAANRDGIYSSMTVSSSGATTGVGTKSFASFTGTSGSLQGLYGLFGRTDVTGSGGTATNSMPLQLESSVGTGATVTNLHMVNIISPTNSGTITNLRGISIGAMTAGTNSWALYQAGASDRSYFAGNVGIGSLDPGSKLDVTGNIRISDGNAINSTGDSIRFHTNRADDDTYEWVRFYSGAQPQGIIAYDDAVGNYPNCQGDQVPSGDVFCIAAEGDSNENWLSLYSLSGTLISGGNVGIGTTSPNARLHVEHNNSITDPNTSNYPLILRNTAWTGSQVSGLEFWNGGNKVVPTARIISQMAGSGAGGENLHFQTQSSSVTNPNPNQPTTKMTILADGNVGIGTTTPNGLLQVGSTVSTGNQYINVVSAANQQAAIGFYSAANQRSVLYRPASSDDLRVWMSTGGDAVTFQQGGNVGVGTISPTSKLHVVGTSNITGAATFGSTVAFTTLGGATNNSILCRNSSNQLAGCNALDIGTQTTGTLGVARGGTGGTTFTANRVLRGNTAGAFLSGIIEDNGTNVGIGSAPGSVRLSVNGNIIATQATATTHVVTAARTVTITNGTGITGGGAAQNMAANLSWTIGLTGQALALHNLGANGIVTRTAAGTFAARTITGTANQVTVTNGNGVSGNPTLSLPQNIHTGASPTFTGVNLSGSLSLTSLIQKSSGTLDIRTTDTSSITLSANTQQRIEINGTSGNVGIGFITNPGRPLDVFNTATTDVGGMVVRNSTGASGAALRLWPGTGGFVLDATQGNFTAGTVNMQLRTGGTTRVTINSNGTVTFANLANSAGIRTICGDAATGGTISAFSGTCGTSSIRYKDNVRDTQYGLDAVLQMRPVVFNYKEGPIEGRMDDRVGFIAEEMFQIAPEVVQYTADGVIDGIDYNNIIPITVNAIKEQQVQINSLGTSLNYINTDITTLNTLASNNLSLTLTDVGSVVIGGSGNNYAVTPVSGGPALTKIIGVAQGVIGKLYAGLVTTKNLVVTSSASIASLSVNSLQVGGQTLQAYIENVVNQMQLASTTSLPSGSVIDELTVGNLTAGNLEAETATVTGSLVVEDTVTANHLAVTTLEAGSTQLGQLLSNEVTILGDATVAGSLNVAGDFTSSGSARLAALESKLAQFEHIQSQTATLYDATVSGTLYANAIAGLDSLISNTVQPTFLQQLIGYDPMSTTSAQLISQITGVDLSDTLVLDPAALEGMPLESVLLGAHAGFFSQYLQVNGNTALGGDLLVVGNIRSASGLSLGSNSLSYLPNLLDECLPEHIEGLGTDEEKEAQQAVCREHVTLRIQPTGSGVLDLMNGLVTLADGSVVIDGEVTFKKNVTVESTLLTDLVAPTSFDRPFQLQVAGVATESGEVKRSRFELIDELGTPVATISAEGVAEFSGDVRAGGSVTADTVNLRSRSDLSDAAGQPEVSTGAASGKAVIAAGQSQVTIKASRTTGSSLIYVTPQGSTGNQVLYVKSQSGDNPDTPESEARFTAGFDSSVSHDVTFTWWIVN